MCSVLIGIVLFQIGIRKCRLERKQRCRRIRGPQETYANTLFFYLLLTSSAQRALDPNSLTNCTYKLKRSHLTRVFTRFVWSYIFIFIFNR